MPRKRTNTRRKKQRHLLDVKASSTQLRRHRTRMAVSIMVLIGVVLATVFAVWKAGYWAAQRFVYQNDSLRIDHVEIRTDGVIRIQMLDKMIGVQRGRNLFSVDLPELKRNLEWFGMIEEVSLSRSLPDTLKIRVHERAPVALIHVGVDRTKSGVTYQVPHALDEAGRHFRLDERIVQPETARAWRALPWLTTTNRNRFLRDSGPQDPQTLAALEFIKSFRRAPIGRKVRIRSVDVDSRFVLRVKTSNHAEVVVLSRDYDRQLARWYDIHQTLARQGQSYSGIDLSVSNNVPVRVASMAPNPSNPSTPQY